MKLPYCSQRVRLSCIDRHLSSKELNAGDIVRVERAEPSYFHDGYAWIKVSDEVSAHCLWEPVEEETLDGWRFRCEVDQLDGPRLFREAEEAGMNCFQLSTQDLKCESPAEHVLFVRRNTKESTYAREFLKRSAGSQSYDYVRGECAIAKAVRAILAGRERDARSVVAKVRRL